jgi:SAM-dependent methyltransferase
LGLNHGQAMEIDFSHQARFYAGVFEIELARHVRALCRPGTDCFDVGAREGYYTLAMAKLARGGRVLALDFDPEWCEHLRRNLDANPSLVPRPEVRTVKVVERGDDARGRVSLDDVAYGDTGFVPGLIKLDIEGDELKALRGAERVLRERMPHLIVESHSPELELECGKLLVAQGYDPFVVKPRRWLPEVRAEYNRWLVARGRPE